MYRWFSSIAMRKITQEEYDALPNSGIACLMNMLSPVNKLSSPYAKGKLPDGKPGIVVYVCEGKKIIGTAVPYSPEKEY